MSAKQKGVKEITANRKAFHEYFVLERFEAGIELAGTEVKSIRGGNVNLKDAFCTIKNGELFIRENAPRNDFRGSAPRRDSSAGRPPRNAPVQPAAPKTADQLFEEKLKAFMSESDSKISSIRQYSDHRTKSRRR